MNKIIFPGSFDPPTLGHLDIITRAVKIFNYVYVAIGYNPDKKTTTFSVEERIELLRIITSNIPNIEIISYNGLLVDFAKKMEVNTILKAIRNITDFDYERMQAQINSELGNVDTLYMGADEKFRHISSSAVKEIASYGRKLHGFVPEEIEKMILDRLFYSKF